MIDAYKYIKYIKNTGRVPLPIGMFDDDWDPIGPSVRRHLVALGAVREVAGGLVLVDEAS